MTLRTVGGRRTGENAEDLRNWLTGLEGCPDISQTVQVICPNPAHAEPATWFYVEADPHAALARRRCLSCGTSTDTLDSAEHWNTPRMWSCPGCSQSIGEVATGFHSDDDGRVSWVVLAIRCVECGGIDGLTDFNIDRVPFDEVAARI